MELDDTKHINTTNQYRTGSLFQTGASQSLALTSTLRLNTKVYHLE